MKFARHMAHRLLAEPEVTPLMLAQAVAVINTLCDVIEAGGMVKPRKPEVPEVSQALRDLRDWHFGQSKQIMRQPIVVEFHRTAVRSLNVYFPKDDQL